MKNLKSVVFLVLVVFLAFFLSGCSHQNESPTARFTPEPKSGEVSLEVSFDASNSSDPDGNIISYDWKVDGESISGGETAEYTFDSAGEWSVELTVRDHGGASDSIEKNVYVTSEQNEKPEASISTDPESREGSVTVRVEEKVEFDASNSSDPDGQIESYEWDFGDSSVPETGKVITHTYEKPGDYTAELSVTDDEFGRDSDSVEVVVEPAFTYNPDNPEAGEEVTFDALGSSSGVQSYEWDFGDGETGTGQTTSHTFDESGDYQVELSVTNDNGEVYSVTEPISISPTPPPPP